MSKLGRPTSYNDKIAFEICQELVTGLSIRRVCEDNDRFPSVRTVMRWLFDYKDFRQQYDIACQLRAEYFAQEIVDISNEEVTANHAAMRNKLRVDSRKWIASRLLPKKYGDQIGVEVSGNVGLDFAGKLQVAIAAKRINSNECSTIEHTGSGQGNADDNLKMIEEGESG